MCYDSSSRGGSRRHDSDDDETNESHTVRQRPGRRGDSPDSYERPAARRKSDRDEYGSDTDRGARGRRGHDEDSEGDLDDGGFDRAAGGSRSSRRPERGGAGPKQRGRGRRERDQQVYDDYDEDEYEDESDAADEGPAAAAAGATPASRIRHAFTTETVGNAEIAKLEAKRKELEDECKVMEWKLQAVTSRAGRSKGGTFVWVLIEYDNYGCERFLNTVSAIPEGWRVVMYRNVRATGSVVPVLGATVIKSRCMGSASKKDDKSAITYPVADLCFSVGDIAANAQNLGTAASTTVYFVCTPLLEPPRYYEVMHVLKKFGIRSFCKNGEGCFEDILVDEGIDPSRFKSGQEHRPPARSASRGPKPRGEHKMRGL
ncbi:hypothetical protein DIPPA_30763 [Diplonema papillatum]|nr:hypothetical protein DIPPA_30763 [Diplonema papillatum]KAJ9463174.1 hypothetical protein DIPPA_30763 [Diplonema papillatum]